MSPRDGVPTAAPLIDAPSAQVAVAEGQADLADAVVAAVRSVPGVVDLHSGAFGEIGTYLPGRRIDGVRLGPDRCAVHLVIEWGAPVLATADAVRSVVSPLVESPVDVTVEDVGDPAPAAHG